WGGDAPPHEAGWRKGRVRPGRGRVDTAGGDFAPVLGVADGHGAPTERPSFVVPSPSRLPRRRLHGAGAVGELGGGPRGSSLRLRRAGSLRALRTGRQRPGTEEEGGQETGENGPLPHGAPPFVLTSVRWKRPLARGIPSLAIEGPAPPRRKASTPEH